MDDDSLKWNTDCVYFLASPLTCKKGSECEYRHSEIARLNPRDCWYWMAGNCLNPTCGFRHPPLDAVAGKESESTQGSSTVSVSKTSVPCYFYVNGYCSKGDKCSFLHANDGGLGSGRPTRIGTGNIDSIPFDFKAVAGKDKESVSDKPADRSKISRHATKDVIFEPKEEIRRQPLRDNIVEQNIDKLAPSSELEDATVTRSETILPEEEYPEEDDGLEEQVVDHIEPEERWESSPGFDVLVDDDSEKLGYEGDPEYYLAVDREGRELNNHFLGHDFEDRAEYESKYHDADSTYDRLENGPFYNHRRHTRDRMLDPLESRKRKLVRMELAPDDSDSVDLRDHLRRRRLADDSSLTDLSRRHKSSYRTSGLREEPPRRNGISNRLLGRLDFNEENETLPYSRDQQEPVGLYNQYKENETLPYSRGQQEPVRLYNQYNSQKKRHSGRQYLSDVSRKTDSRDPGFPREASTFSGPKSLAQIREEKRKAEENGDYYSENHSSRSIIANFESPKRLSEIQEAKWGFNSAAEEEEEE